MKSSETLCSCKAFEQFPLYIYCLYLKIKVFNTTVKLSDVHVHMVEVEIWAINLLISKFSLLSILDNLCCDDDVSFLIKMKVLAILI